METINMTTFFRKLYKEGIKLVLKNGSLNIKANSEIDPEILVEIKANKALIIDYLKSFENDNISEQLLEKITPYNKETLEHIPLSFGQERLWFLDQLQGGSEEYHIPNIIRLKGDIEVAIIEQTLKTIVARHEVLRTVIYEEGGIGYQKVLSEANWSLSKVVTSKEVNLEAEIDSFISTPFDLSKDYMLRACLFDLGENQYVLAFVFHHIASDGWSSGILTNEFEAIYTLIEAKEDYQLPELSLQYSDYAIWQRNYFEKNFLETQLSYWKEKLKGVSILNLPIDYKRSNVQENKGGEVFLELDEKLYKSINLLCQNEKVTPFMFLLSLFKVLLYRYSDQEDICVGTPIANRTQSELEDMMGFFVNTLALRSNLSDNLTFKELLNQVKQTTLESYDNQLVPFEKVVDSVVTDRDMSITPLFQVMFDYQNGSNGLNEEEVNIREEDLEEDAEFSMSAYETSEVTVQFDLTLSIVETESSFNLNMSYRSSLFKEETIHRLMRHYSELLNSTIKNIAVPINELSILSEKEKVQLLEDFNKTEVSYPLGKTLVDLFSEQVAKTPKTIAVVYEDEILTYEELDKRSNQLGHYLRNQGVKPDTLVGICLERSLEMLIGVLGILKSGGAYVPIDPNYPQNRIDYMLNDANINLVLSSEAISQKVLKNRENITVMPLDSEWKIIASHHTTSLSKVLTSENLAYVIYTSGSTGKPKGVMNTHKGVVNRLLWTQSEYKLQSDDVILQKTTFSFDVSVWELLWASICGAKLVLARPEGHKDAFYLKETIENYRITTMHFVPSMLRVFLEAVNMGDCSCLRRIICSGEHLLVNDVKVFNKKFKNVALHNLYGPTEAAIDVSYWNVPLHTSIPKVLIGKPIANTGLYVVDSAMNLVPIGVAGELCIEGVQVAKGYLNREALTEEKFLVSPFKEGERVYKTGDLARWLPDGNIELLGRKDNQVKIRGYRIELGEIEKAVSSLEFVCQSCVLAKEDINGNKRLVGYVVVEGEFDKEVIQSQLKKTLPDYMVPRLWVELKEMPLTTNGKLDRKSLPEIEGAILSTKEYVAPRDKTEENLVAIWQDLLAIDKVGVYDDFFEIGGHSLLIIQLISRLQKIGLHIEVRDVFLNPTIVGIKEKLSSIDAIYKVPANGITRTTERIVPSMVPLLDFVQDDIDKIVATIEGGVSNIQDIYPLAPLQEGMYFHYLISKKEEGDPYILPHTLSFSDKEKRSSFIKALQFVVNRHDVLRTCIISQDLPNAVQVVLRKAELPVEELIIDNSKDIQSELELLTIPGNQWMDVSKAPLLDLKLVDDLENDDYYLIINQHHLMLDHIGLEKVMSEIFMYLSGKASELLKPVLYRDFIGHTLHLQKTNNSETYFSKLLENIEEPTYPFELSSIQGGIRNIKESEIILPSRLSNEIRSISAELGMSPAVLFHAAYGIVVSKCSNKNYALFGSLFSGRLQGTVGAADSLGLFINTLPFLVELKGHALEYVNVVKNRLRELLSHEQTPLSAVQGWSAIANDVPFFSALLNYRHSSTSPEEKEEDTVDLGGTFINGHERTNYPFTVSVDDFGNDFGLTAQVAGNIDPKRVLSYIKETLEELIVGIESENNLPIHKLSILSKQEENKLLHVFNNTNFEYPKNDSIVSLFKKQVAKIPNKPALVFEGKSLTYKELDLRSNQLVNYLAAKKIKKNTRVGILFDRSFEMLISMLGILKFGGSYVPLDFTLPINRLGHILKDAGIKTILYKEATLLESLPISKTINTLSIEKLSKYKTKEKEFERFEETEAYVMYTSGTTGNPKGISISDENVITLINNPSAAIAITSSDRVLQWSNYAFDGCTYEIFGSLLNGATLHLIPTLAASNPAELLNVINNEKITVTFITTALFNTLSEYDVSLLSSIRLLLFGGEKVAVAPVEKVFSTLGPNKIIHVYGPTETTTYASCEVISEITPKATTVPIGSPLSNTKFYVLNEDEELVPIGSVGELCISGSGVSKGYLNREELTNKLFKDNPFNKEERIYKTGDLVRWLPNGSIEFVGRKDNQVKIRGYRIELGEIENVLSQVKEIQNSCVVIKEDAVGNKRLIGYVVSEGAFNKEVVESKLKESLPDYMIPMAWVELDEIPLTSNGKLDKKNLPKPSFSSGENYVAPTTQLEESLCKIWQEVLGIEKVGIKDDFFNIGGNSILAIKVSSEMSKVLGLKIQISDIIRYKSIGILSAIYSKLQAYENHVSLVMPYNEQYDNNLADMIFIHSAMGGSDAYYCLAELLKGKYNCIGIDNQNIYGEPKISNLNELASFYVNKYIEKYSIKDPIILLGWSLGGSIALEMAVILESKGYTNIKVILLDTYIQLPKQKRIRIRKTFDKKGTRDFIANMFSEEYSDYVDKLVDAFKAEQILAQAPISKQLSETQITLFQALYKDDNSAKANNNDELILIEDLQYNNLEHVIDVNKITIVPTHAHHRHILPFQAKFIGDYLLTNIEELSAKAESSTQV